MNGVQQLEIQTDESDQRLDRWFRRRFPHVPQGRIEKMCRKGEIRLDGHRVKPATRVEAGQVVRVPPLPERVAPLPENPQISDADVKLMRDAVLFRDDHILALNKPAGLPSQGGSKVTRHVDGLSEALRFGFDEKPRLVHRLDKDTSGVLLMARTRSVASALTKSFRARDTRKIYWAAVAGTPSPSMGTIRYGLVKAPGHGKGGEGEKMIALHPKEVENTKGAKHATTDYGILSSLGTRASWAALVPITGRTHQLRAHMAAIGHPIVGDGKYGGSGQENLGDGWGAQLGGEISRKLHLHARSLSFDHPITAKRITLVAPLPPHMAHTWDMFDWSAADVPADPFEEEDMV
ncbi:MAG: RluA family pseudouridine synthase [Pseudomonadota bacterium]